MGICRGRATPGSKRRRGYAGNIEFDILIDEARPNTVLFYEVWESLEAQQAYMAWRVGAGDLTTLNSFLAGEPKFTALRSVADRFTSKRRRSNRWVRRSAYGRTRLRRSPVGRSCIGDDRMEPNLGQGACQALEDAAALGVVAALTPPDQMLAAFEKLRLRRVRAIVRQSAEGRPGAHESRPARALLRAVLRAMPAAVTDRVAQAVHTMPEYA